MRREHSSLAEEASKMREQISHLDRKLEDADDKFEGIAATLESAAQQTEIWAVQNILSRVQHRAAFDFSITPANWKTLCGWPFSGKHHARTNRDMHAVMGHRSCPRCYASAKDDTSSESTSSSED